MGVLESLRIGRPICERSAAELRNEVKGLGLDPTGASTKEMEMMIAMATWAKKNPGEEFPDQFDPMPYWIANDKHGRIGISEIKPIEDYMHSGTVFWPFRPTC